MLFCLGRISLITCFMVCMGFASSAYSKEAFPTIWNVQNSNQYYVGRNVLLMDIHSAFNSKHEVAIVGSAGIGKTQLAKKYAETFRSHYDLIWWLDVGKNLDEQYLELVLEWNRAYANEQINTYLPKDEIIKQMKDCLRVANKNWLLIFDNVTDKDQLSPYTPNKHNDKSLGHILITSKNPYTWSHAMKLDKFTRAESVELIKKIANEDNPSSINALAETLGDYPLAIVQAASYVKSHPGLNIKGYTQLFLTNRKKLWADENSNKGKHTAFDNYAYTVFATLSLTIDEIKKESPEAFELLVFCAYLNGKSIPEPLLANYSANSLKTDNLSFRNNLAILGKYSLISENKSTQSKSDDITYTMHELSQLTVLDMLSKKEKIQHIEKGLSATAPFLPDKMDVFITYLQHHPHITPNLEYITEHAVANGVLNNDLLTLKQRLLEYNLPGKRDFATSQKLIEDIEQLSKQVSNHSPVLKARFSVMRSAFLAWQRLDYQKSLAFAEEALELLKKLPEKYEEKLMAYNRLAQLYNLMGDNDNALIYAKKGEEVVSKDQNVGNQDALYQSFAKIYSDNGDFKRALEYSEKTINKIANKSNKMSVGEIPTYLTRPITLIKMSKYQEAFKHLDDLYNTSVDTFSQNDHFYKAVIYSYYGYVLYVYKNEPVKAKYLLLESQEMFRRLFGKNSLRNKSLAASHRLLGEIYEKEGNNIKAQSEYAQAIQITFNSYDGMKVIDDFSDLYTRLAIINAKLEETATAQHYLNLHRKYFGQDHPRTNEITEYFLEKNMVVGF